jgi:opacity protein-like surface antigen
MKKILTLALTAALLLSSVSMFACSSDSADNTTTTTAGTTTAATTTAATTAGSTTTNPTETSGSATTGGEDAELYYWFDLNREDETEYIDTTEMRANYVNLTVDHNATISSKSNFVGFDWTDDENNADLGNEGPQQLFDDDSTTKYCGSSANCEDKYVIFTTDQAVTVKAYIYTTANDNATYTDRNLEAWALLATNTELGDDWELTEDNYTDWTVLDIVYYCNLPDENYTECGFEIDEENQGAYSTYMFYVLWGETQSGVLQVADITILGTD